MDKKQKTVAEFLEEISKQSDSGMAMRLNGLVNVLVDEDKLFSREDKLTSTILSQMRMGIYEKTGEGTPVEYLAMEMACATGNVGEASLQYIEKEMNLVM